MNCQQFWQSIADHPLESTTALSTTLASYNVAEIALVRQRLPTLQLRADIRFHLRPGSRVPTDFPTRDFDSVHVPVDVSGVGCKRQRGRPHHVHAGKRACFKRAEGVLTKFVRPKDPSRRAQAYCPLAAVARRPNESW